MSMKVDYKWWFVKRDDNGKITEVAVRFYEGDYQTIAEQQVYVRSAKLGAGDVAVNLKGSATVDSSGSYARKYTMDDFGDISTDDELRDFCNSELVKDKTRTPIPEQLTITP